MPISRKEAVMLRGPSGLLLTRATTKVAPTSGPAQTSVSCEKSRATRRPWMPRGSWLTAMTSWLVSTERDSGDSEDSVHPMMRGALASAHRVKCTRNSDSVRALGSDGLGHSSMSGSFQPPGPAKGHQASFSMMLCMMRAHELEMSPVVLQLLPTCGAQSAGKSCPHSHMEKRMGLPQEARASRMGGYLTSGEMPSLLQLSYLR